MSNLKLSITHQKILDTVRLLNEANFYPNSEGVYKILAGVIDEETINYKDSDTFSTLISFNIKKVSRYILLLVRYGYLEKIYDKITNDLYLKISFKGLETSQNFHKKYKKPYPKSLKKLKRTIVKIY